MHQLNEFKYFSLNPNIYEIVSNKGRNGNKSSYFVKYKRKVCVGIFVLAMTLIIFYLIKSTSISAMQKREKAKRSVKMNDYNEYSNIIKTPKTNIELIPQNRKIKQHRNHKNTEKEPQNDSQTLINKMNATKGWSSEPFQSKTDKRLPLIQDKILKSEFNIQKPKEREKIVNELLTDSESSMRLKGVYSQSENKNIASKNELDGKYFYSKEINNLMLNDFDGREERKKSFMNGFRSHGAPFQLPGIGQESLNRNKITQENIRLSEIFKKQPITIYLEIYPMNDFQGMKRKFKQENKFYNSESNYIFNLEKMSPKDRRNRMIMKLNLYPKERYFRADPRSKYNKKPERKSFGWFFKHKKKKNKPKECPFMGIHPHGKHIKVKWKNKYGEWIHAEKLTIKSLNKDKKYDKN